MRFIWSCLCLVLLVSAARAGDLAIYRSLAGAAANDYFGNSVDSAGDVNGDGYDDYIVGAMNNDKTGNSAGMAGVYSGKDGKAIYLLYGGKAGDQYGCSVAGIGDIDGDDYSDFIVGALAADDVATNSGTAYVYSGKTGKVLYTYKGGTKDGYFGSMVCGLGDVDDDDVPDFAISAPRESDGTIRVYSGTDGTRLYSLTAPSVRSACLGETLAVAGDVNADGIPDLIAGDPEYDSYAGMARVYSGDDGTLLYTIYGNDGVDHDRLGRQVGTAGDVNGDGYDDFITAARYANKDYSTAGRVVVWSGKTGLALYTLYGTVTHQSLGIGIAGPGDLNGDGYDDFVLGSMDYDTSNRQTGAIRIYSGKDGKLSHQIFGKAAGDTFGYRIAVLDDISGDDQADLLVAAIGEDKLGGETGGIHILARQAPTGTVTIDGGAAYTGSTTCSLALTWKGQGATVDEMRIRNEGESWGSWIAAAASASHTLEDLDGKRVVEAQVRDTDGTPSDVLSASIVLDRVGPTVSMAIEAGADAVGSLQVSLSLSAADATSGVADLRFRNAGGAWSAWYPVADTHLWDLEPGDGIKTVECQSRDTAGNVSEVASDTILLDTSAPGGTITIDGGAEFTGLTKVTLAFTSTDVGTGVSAYRVRNRNGAWTPWEALVASRSWLLDPAGGPQTVDAEYRDLAGNTSPMASATIIVDMVPPNAPKVLLNAGAAYIRAEDELRFTLTTADNVGGSGTSAFRFSVDGGTAWSDWIEFTPDVPAVAPHPAAQGLTTVAVVVRDRAGNVSEPGSGRTYFLESERLGISGAAKIATAFDVEGDVDTLTLDLVAGDLLSVKIKTRAPTRSLDLRVGADLYGPDGSRLVESAYPVDSRKPGIKKFPVTATGRHLLVLRADPDTESRRGTIALKISVKQSKLNKKFTGESAIEFAAAEGMILTAMIKANGLTAEGISLTGPTGKVAVEPRTTSSKAKIPATTLGAGTGLYRLALPEGVTGTIKVKLKLPKKWKGELSE